MLLDCQNEGLFQGAVRVIHTHAYNGNRLQIAIIIATVPFGRRHFVFMYIDFEVSKGDAMLRR